MQTVTSETLYARVDIARDDVGDLRLMELELDRAVAWAGPRARRPTRFAAAIAQRLA